MSKIRPYLKRVIQHVCETLAYRNRTEAGGGMEPFSSTHYWESRYRAGGTSGSGSEGELAEFKASFLNRFVAEMEVQSVVEFGCGDGRQLALAKYPAYVGLDVSQEAVRLCSTRFAHDPTKRFLLYTPKRFGKQVEAARAELSLSIDVVYHLVEDEVFRLHLAHLFLAATKYVIVYSTNMDNPHDVAAHVHHRVFTPYVAASFPEWSLVDVVPNPTASRGEHGSYADFHVFARTGIRA